MSAPVKLLFGVHAHQPVGNFDWVIDDAHRRCYQPFLQTLHRYPEFRFAFHASGWLLGYLIDRFPEDMALLKEMVERGQIELFGSGDTEPVLAVIPETDRLGQLQALSDRLERFAQQRPTGAWLTERVWEATVVPSLEKAGIQYVTVDDYHFFCTGIESAKLDGYYITEEGGHRLALYPISEALRYRLPFAPAAEAVAYLASLATDADDRAAIYFDDIEKFGIWPETYDWVYNRGWLEQFIEGVLKSEAIQTMRYQDHHQIAQPRGIVYLPTTSYIEMGEWTLPASAAHEHDALIHEQKNANTFEQRKGFIRGGIWKNFFSLYSESNWMHKRMLDLSQRVQSLPHQHFTPDMRTALYEAQANDAYWHGLFGGLYLPHLRHAIYRAIVKLEAMVDQVQPRPELMEKDFNFDGVEEIFLHNSILQIIVQPNQSASIGELDLYEQQHNIVNTLARREEAYYQKILAHSAQQEGSAPSEGIASAHDRISFKNQIVKEDLQPDPYPRNLFLETTDEEGLLEYTLKDATSTSLHFTAPTFEKRYTLLENGLRTNIALTGEMSGKLTSQLNLSMPSCDGPGAQVKVNNLEVLGLGAPLEAEKVKSILLSDDILGADLELTISPPADLLAGPFFTVSQSEAGFEKVMQAYSIQLSWPLQTGLEIRIDLRVRP